MRKKRLLIDVNSIVPYLQTGVSMGVGRSTFELVSAISELEDIPFEIGLFTQNLRGVKAKGRFPLKTHHLYIPNRSPFGYITNKLHLKKIFFNYDLLHIPHNTDWCEIFQKTIFTIHDLIVYRYPELWNLTEKSKAYFREVATKSKAILTCSESSKQDIIDFWEVNENKVTAIPWGINQEVFHFTTNESFLHSIGIKGEFFFSASCNHGRKNTSMILEAYIKYLQKGGKKQLVLLSPSAKDLVPYEANIERKEIIVCSHISDIELASLYSEAHCSIVASSFEGFGFPVIESLSCGTQVLCAQNSSLTEVGGHVVDYFSELKSECICNKFLEYDHIPKENTLDISMCRSHLSKFTWKNCAEKYVETYEQLLYS